MKYIRIKEYKSNSRLCSGLAAYIAYTDVETAFNGLHISGFGLLDSRWLSAHSLGTVPDAHDATHAEVVEVCGTRVEGVGGAVAIQTSFENLDSDLVIENVLEEAVEGGSVQDAE